MLIISRIKGKIITIKGFTLIQVLRVCCCLFKTAGQALKQS